jgi:hypothetical protein
MITDKEIDEICDLFWKSQKSELAKALKNYFEQKKLLGEIYLKYHPSLINSDTPLSVRNTVSREEWWLKVMKGKLTDMGFYEWDKATDALRYDLEKATND